MVDVAHLLDELQLRGVEVKVGHLAVDKLARDASDGDNSDISHVGLCSQFVGSKLLFGGQRARHEVSEHGSLTIFLGQFLKGLFPGFLGLGNILLVSGLQLVRNGISAILQTVEQRHDIGMVHISGTRATSYEVVRRTAI